MCDLLVQMLAPLCTGFAVALALGYLRRTSQETRDDRRLEYSRFPKAMGWIMSAFAIVTVIAMFVVDHDGEYLLFSAAAALLGLGGLYLLLETNRTGFFNDDRISLSSLLGRQRVGRWSELQSATFKKNGQYYELVFSDGTRMDLSIALQGHREVCDHVESLGMIIENRPGKG